METTHFLSRLENVRKSGLGWTARCPGHDDGQNSLSIGIGQVGVLLKCFSGCEPQKITSALGLKMGDLFFDGGAKDNGYQPKPTVTRKPIAARATVDEAKNAIPELFKMALNEGYKLTEVYPYDGYFRVRFDHPEKGKLIRPIFKTAQGWKYGEPSFPQGGKPLYRKDKIASNPNATIFVCEGEKCCDALDGLGLIATTSGSASSADGSDWEPLKGRNVILWPDNDEPGQRYADNVEGHLTRLGCHAERIDVAALNLPEGGDVVDWLAAHPSATIKDVESLPRMAPTSKGDGWPEPIALDAVRIPDLPDDVFSGWLGAMVNGVSQATETPHELAASFVLAVLGVAAQGKFCVMPSLGYFEPLSIWVITALESGNRKTSVMQMMTRPLTEWERDKASELRPEIERLASERKTMEARIGNLRSRAARHEGVEFQIAQAEIAELEAGLPAIPIVPRLWCQDTTPEKLGVVMAEQGERIGLLSDEGGIFDTLAGRYSSGIPNLDLFLQGHAGSPVRVDRQGREPVYMNAPALTVGISPQPETIRRLADNSSFRGRGLLARFLYFLPSSPLGRRTLESRPVPKNITDEYDRAIRRLLDLQPAIGDNGWPRPHILRFTPEAHAEWKEAAHCVERNLRDGGQFEHIKDWGGKLPGACARLAGLLHCAEHAFDEPWAHEINADTVNRALSLGAVFSKHALAVFDLIGADESLDAARKVWRWVERTRPETFTARDAFHALQRTFHSMEAMEPGLAILVERSFIRELEGDRRAGRPSRKFTINLRIVEGWL